MSGSRRLFAGSGPSLVTFFAIVAILSPLAFLGIDLRDSGLFLHDQEKTLRDGMVVNRLWWFSDYLGGWWLRASSPYGLVGARMGGVICVALSGALSVATAGRYFGRSHWIFALAAIAVAPIARPLILMAQYYSIPMVLSLLFAFAYASLVRNVEAGRPATVSAMAGGALLAALILAKVTCAIAIALPLAATVLGILFDRSQLRQTVRANAVLLASAVGCGLVLAGYVVATQGVDAFSVLPADPYPRERYSLWSMLETAGAQARPHLLVLGILFGGSVVAGIGLRSRALAAVWFAGCLLLGCMASLAKTPGFAPLSELVPGWLQLSSGNTAWTLSNFVLLVFGPLAVGSLVLVIREAVIERRPDSRRLAVMCLFAVLLPVVLGLGSTEGFAKFRLGLWLLVLIVVALALREQEPAARRAREVSLVCVFVVILLASLSHAYTQFYGDTPNIRGYTYRFEEGRLEGVRTEPLRGRLLSTLLAQIQERTDPSATILAYGDCPMVYYASGRSAYRGLVWPRVYSEEYLETKLTDPSRDEPPALLVRYKRRGKGAKLIDQRIREAFRPRTLWQNLAFEILEPTIHPGGR